MIGFFLKQQCKPENVRFSRFINTMMISTYALFGSIEGMYAMLVFTLSTIIFTSRYSLATAVLSLLNILGFQKIFKLNPRYQQSFFITRANELYEEVLRLFVGLIVIALYYYGFMMPSVAVAFFMATMMLISTFFGFCASGLLYIAYRTVSAKIKHD